MTASAQVTSPATTRPAHSPLPALAGLGALGSLAASVVVFGDAMGGSATAAEAAEALAGSAAQGSAVLAGLYALFGIAVAGMLAARLGRVRDTGATRLIAVLGTVHLLLMTLFTVAPAAAVTVGTLVLDGGVSPVGAESALVLMNVVHPVAAWMGAAFLIAVAVAARSESRPLTIASAVFAAGFLLPPVGWAVGYLMGAWFAGVGVWLWRRP